MRTWLNFACNVTETLGLADVVVVLGDTTALRAFLGDMKDLERLCRPGSCVCVPPLTQETPDSYDNSHVEKLLHHFDAKSRSDHCPRPRATHHNTFSALL